VTAISTPRTLGTALSFAYWRYPVNLGAALTDAAAGAAVTAGARSALTPPTWTRRSGTSRI